MLQSPSTMAHFLTLVTFGVMGSLSGRCSRTEIPLMVTGRELRSANTTETLLYAHVAWHAVGYDNKLAKWLLKSNAFLQKYASLGIYVVNFTSYN